MKLKELRIKNGFSQTTLAEQLEIKQETYSNYEREITQPPIEWLIKLANYYNVSLDYLCDNEQTTKKVVYLDNLTKEQAELIEIVKTNDISKEDIEIFSKLVNLNIFQKGMLLGQIMAETKEDNQSIYNKN